MEKKQYRKSFTFDGRRYYIRGDSPEDLAAKVALKKRDLEEGKRLVSPNMTVSAWAHEWLVTYKKKSVNAKHYKDIAGAIRKHIEPQIGSMKLKDVRPVHLQRVLNDMTAFSDSYVSKVYDIVRQMFSKARLNSLIVKDPAEGLEKPSGKGKQRRRPITQTERELTLKVADTYRGGTFVLLMLYCGLRPGEVAALTWSNVDLDKRIIHVRKALKSDGSIDLPKTSAGYRDVPIPQNLAERLRNEPRTSMLVCTNSEGGMYTESSMQRMFRVYRNKMNKAGGCKTFKGHVMPPYAIGDDLTLYCYRHTYCTDLQAAGVPINVAKELMGHSNISVTAQIYTHKSEAAFKNAADLIDAYAKKGVPKGVPKEAQPLENTANNR